jgi:hypothetical protein
VLHNTGLAVAAQNVSYVYDGSTHGLSDVKVSVNGNAAPQDHILYYSTSSAADGFSTTAPAFSDVGTYTVWIKALAPNYVDSPVVEVSVAITHREITLKPQDRTKPYDGTALSANSVEIVQGSLVFGHSLDLLNAVFSGSITAPGTIQSTLSGVSISGARQYNYLIIYRPGSLTVTGTVPLPVVPETEDEEEEEAEEEESTTPARDTSDRGDDVDSTQTPPAPATSLVLDGDPIGFSEEDITKLEAQTGNPFVDIAAGNVPLGGFSVSGVWSLLNLLFVLVSLIIAIATFAFVLIRRRFAQATSFERTSQTKVSRIFTALSVALGAAILIVWLLCDDITQPMAWMNSWTPLIGALFVAHLVSCVLCWIKGGASKPSERALS